MQLTPRVRRTYLAVLIVLAAGVIPTALLYASGYRLADGFSLVETGGLYISVPAAGATVSVNGAVKGVSSLFDRSFYFDDLEPGSYVVQVASEGAHPWYRTLVVEPRIVTDARALLLPQSLAAVELLRGGSRDDDDAIAIPAAQYDAYKAAFAATSTAAKAVATSTAAEASLDTNGGFALAIEEGRLYVRWTRGSSGTPSVLCIRPSACRASVPVGQSTERVLDARFFAGGVVYETRDRGIIFAEIDARPTALHVPLYQKKGATFRVVNGALIVKDGTKLYQIRGW